MTQSLDRVVTGEVLTAAMPNEYAYCLGDIALVAGATDRKDVGDLIDRGLILRRILDEEGFLIVRKP